MKRQLLLLFLLLLLPGMILADASIPTKDIQKSHDPSFLKRYEGSLIIAFRHKSFDQLVLPLSRLEPRPDLRDQHNNIKFAPSEKKVVEGEYYRIVYLIPPGHSPLEILRNYENEIKSLNGRILFSCQGADCGGDPHRACSGGGGDMSLSMFLESEEDVLSYNEEFSNGYCGLVSRINDQHFLAAHLPEQEVYLSVLTYEIGESAFCNAFNKRTVAVIDIVKSGQMAQKMVVVKAEKMAKEIDSKGSVAIYGIYFDTGKADIKPESGPTFQQIAKLMKSHPSLKLLVVGHTDNQGSFSYNMDLSTRRAKAVINELTSRYRLDRNRLKAVGVGYACPKATNRTDEGRAKNRRVELVEQ